MENTGDDEAEAQSVGSSFRSGHVRERRALHHHVELCVLGSGGLQLHTGLHLPLRWRRENVFSFWLAIQQKNKLQQTKIAICLFSFYLRIKQN